MSGKQFLFSLAGVALVVWIGANYFLGPPGYAPDYAEAFGAQHERYLEITKNPAFQQYRQRPHLGPGEETAAGARFAEMLAFVHAYESTPEFKAEKRRQTIYETFFGFFNASLLVVIGWRFGRRPLLDFLERGAAELRERMDESARAAADAQARLAGARANMARLTQEEQRVLEEMEQRQWAELAELEKANKQSLALMEQEIADRKQEIANAARLQVKAELVDAVIARVEKWHESEARDAYQDALIQQFATDLEQRA